MLYNHLSRYLKETYGGTVRKICIDGGFTCPNRDGTCGTGGCIFCGERGAGEHITNRSLSVREQVRAYLADHPRGDTLIAYFQNFTNTYAPVRELKEIYDSALIDPRIRILAIGTRPDCISEETAELIASYRSRVDVWVELGLQTANDETAKVINRGYPREVFTQAAEILNRYQIPVVAHVMIGLPGETGKDVEETTRFLNRHHLWGIKIHSLYVMKDTVLEKMYLNGAFQSISMDEYISSVVYMLTHLPPEMIIHRLTGDCPKGLLTAPDWNPKKNEILQMIRDRMNEQGLRQGIFYETDQSLRKEGE